MHTKIDRKMGTRVENRLSPYDIVRSKTDYVLDAQTNSLQNRLSGLSRLLVRRIGKYIGKHVL